MMERLFSAPAVVAFWGVLNVIALALLAGFVGAGFGGEMVEVYIYIGSALLVFLLAALAWLARRRRLRGLDRGLGLSRRPAAALLLALAFALLWLGLAFGLWITLFAAPLLGAAVIMEIAARHRA